MGTYLNPGRFGKTITADMLAAYYGKGDSRSLFEKRKLAEKDEWDMTVKPGKYSYLTMRY